MSESECNRKPKTMKRCPKMTPHFWAEQAKMGDSPSQKNMIDDLVFIMLMEVLM